LEADEQSKLAEGYAVARINLDDVHDVHVLSIKYGDRTIGLTEASFDDLRPDDFDYDNERTMAIIWKKALEIADKLHAKGLWSMEDNREITREDIESSNSRANI
jgi:hypothetical protein